MTSGEGNQIGMLWTPDHTDHILKSVAYQTDYLQPGYLQVKVFVGINTFFLLYGPFAAKGSSRSLEFSKPQVLKISYISYPFSYIPKFTFRREVNKRKIITLSGCFQFV